MNKRIVLMSLLEMPLWAMQKPTYEEKCGHLKAKIFHFLSSHYATSISCDDAMMTITGKKEPDNTDAMSLVEAVRCIEKRSSDADHAFQPYKKQKLEKNNHAKK